MQMSDYSNPYTRSISAGSLRPRKRIVQEELELRNRPSSEISPWWQIITVLCYFTVATGGIITSITVGTLLSAFQDRCLFYARITVKGLEEIIASGGNKTLDDENIVEENYGVLEDCLFSQYWSVASTMFGVAWAIMFLQCGRGGTSLRNAREAWIIVPPAIVVDITFFIVSCIILGKTTGGLSFFCQHLRAENQDGIVSNITSCKEIMAFNFPGDVYKTDLYLNYVLAQFGAVLTFVGWLITLFVIIIRCFIPVDFVVYGRRRYSVVNPPTTSRKSSQSTTASTTSKSANTTVTQRKRQLFANSRSSAIDEEDDLTSNSTSVEVLSDNSVPEGTLIATTSFCTLPGERKYSKKQS